MNLYYSLPDFVFLRNFILLAQDTAGENPRRNGVFVEKRNDWIPHMEWRGGFMRPQFITVSAK